MENILTINIFTNCIKSSPRINFIQQTMVSLFDNFRISKNIDINIFIDKNPHKDNYIEYKKNIREFLFNNKFKNVNVINSDSLSNSYIKSVYLSNTPYAFQVEHD